MKKRDYFLGSDQARHGKSFKTFKHDILGNEIPANVSNFHNTKDEQKYAIV